MSLNREKARHVANSHTTPMRHPPIRSGRFGGGIRNSVSADGSSGPAMTGAGSTTASISDFGGTTYGYLSGSQALSDSSGATFTMEHTIITVGETGKAPAAIELGSAATDAMSGAGVSFTLVPSGGSVWDNDAIVYVSCSLEDWTLETHVISFEGGEVTLVMDLGLNTVQTAPGAFISAEGELDGTSFAEDNFFQLIYRPGHHHFSRDFAILFDKPIGDACGLQIVGVVPQEGDMSPTISLVDCDLGELESRVLTGATYTIGG